LQHKLRYPVRKSWTSCWPRSRSIRIPCSPKSQRPRRIPREILDVDNWLQDNQGLTGTALTDAAQQQGFNPAFIALVNFPQVLEMMAQHVDDYAAIGQAFSADQEAVSASVQRLRSQAYAAGTLRSTPQQQVVVQQPAGQTIYVIQPASPQVVYVPQYDPAVVYVRPSTDAIVVASLIRFGVGIGIAALLVDNRPWGWGGWGWNWGSRRVYYNHVVWGGWHSPYRPAPMVSSAGDCVVQPSGLTRRLALPSAKLSPASSSV
jgi:Protein of unknown function (DUF3300)